MAARIDVFKLPTLKPSAERRLDAEEIIRWVLPRCQIRPYVYNQVAKVAERLQNEADEMALIEARAAGEEYKPLKRTSFIMHMPVNSPNVPIAERRLDLALVTDLSAVKRRSVVTMQLNNIRVRMQKQIRTMESDQEESNHRGSQERLLMLQTYLAVLPRLRDRPRVYNQLGAHIAMLVEGEPDAHKYKVPITIAEEESERTKSSRDYWEDVRLLDEIMDTLTDGSFAKAAIGTMKTSAVADARARQEVEAEQLAKRRFARRPIGGFEEVRMTI
jgi:hypothetical protein